MWTNRPASLGDARGRRAAGLATPDAIQWLLLNLRAGELSR
jgi:hypothetical protein